MTLEEMREKFKHKLHKMREISLMIDLKEDGTMLFDGKEHESLNLRTETETHEMVLMITKK